jgi:hypothetical protein
MTSWHKMTVAVNMSRNDQEMKQQTQAMPRENKENGYGMLEVDHGK